MKKTRLLWKGLLAGLMLSLGLVIGCQKETKAPASINQLHSKAEITATATTCNPLPEDFQCPEDGPYIIELKEFNAPVNGNYAWTWQVTPKEGTQGISHWNLFLPASCITIDDVVNIYYSYDNQNFTLLDKKYGVDPSLSTCSEALDAAQYCVLKFDQGHGSNGTIYYRLVVNKQFAKGQAVSIFKSGTNTGCGFQCYEGISCETPPPSGCVWSQGYWFANPQRFDRWKGGTLTIGGKTYTEAEGKAIWNTSNARGLVTCKQAFTQGGAVLLSMAADPGIVVPKSVTDALTAIETYLSKIGKLVPVLKKVNNQMVYVIECGSGASAQEEKAARDAASFIGTWISEQPCKNATTNYQ